MPDDTQKLLDKWGIPPMPTQLDHARLLLDAYLDYFNRTSTRNR